MIVFVAHFTGFSYCDLMEMPIREICYWHTQAVEVHNKLNKPPE